jgi:hypothetical protein
LAPGAIEIIKILVPVLEIPAKQHCQFSLFGPFLREMGWIGTAVYLGVSSKMASRILILSTAMGADYSFEV